MEQSVHVMTIVSTDWSGNGIASAVPSNSSIDTERPVAARRAIDKSLVDGSSPTRNVPAA
jgi:hypothetical protein